MNCTLLVCSCDKYSDLWYPFFTMLKKNWPEFDMQIVLNTESKSFHYEGLNIKTFNLYKIGENVPWGQRLIEHLDKINTEYVLFMLDDFFIESKVDSQKIDECISWMDKDKNIATFGLVSMPLRCIDDNKYPGFSRRTQNGDYRLNCQAALWRTKLLKSYIRPHEAPWHFETLGSKRSRRYKEKFYMYKGDNTKKIINYDWYNGGAIHRGKWTISGARIIQNNEFNLDINDRGICTDNQHSSIKTKTKFYMSKMNISEIIKGLKIRYLSYKK